MKSLSLCLSAVLLLVSSIALATPIGSNPTLEKRLLRIEAGTGLSTGSVNTTTILDGTVKEVDLGAEGGKGSNGLGVLRIARATVDCTTAANCTVGAHSLGVTLPAKSIIIRSWLYTVAQLTDTGTCTFAISCEDANNIKTATDFGGVAADTLTEGASTGAASAFTKSIAAACAITATVADGGSCAPPTVGSMNVWVEYVVQD